VVNCSDHPAATSRPHFWGNLGSRE